MANIAEFIEKASQEFEETEESTRSATGGLLEALREQSKEEDFRKMVDAIPAAAALLHTHAAATVEHSHHGIGHAVTWLNAFLGGTQGEVGLLQAMEEAGFSTRKVARFVASFKAFATQQAGADLVEKVFAEAPDLAILEHKGHGTPGW